MGHIRLSSSVAIAASRAISTSKRDRPIAKYWLDPIALVKYRGRREQELNQNERLVRLGMTTSPPVALDMLGVNHGRSRTERKPLFKIFGQCVA